MPNNSYHTPVMLQECLQGLSIRPDGTYVDVTFGAGGHSRAILGLLGEKGRLIAFDQDPDAQRNTLSDARFQLIPHNFRHLRRFLRFYGVGKVDGVLADFGVSSYQFDEPTRGFSTRFDGELDMRMNPQSGLSAQNIVNEYSQEQLAQLFYEYGELKNARKIAQLIVQAREKNPIMTTLELKRTLLSVLPSFKEHKILAQIYQALRIEVNDELGALKEFLLQLPEVLTTGGRIALMSYHSLEDRLVKNFIGQGKLTGQADKDFYGNVSVPFKKVEKGLWVPTEQEIMQNNRARSAKLRIAQRL